MEEFWGEQAKRSSNQVKLGWETGIEPATFGATATVTVFDWGNGSAVLYQNASLPVSVGDVFLLSAQGTTISVYQNGSLLNAATSSFTASAGTIFIRTSPGDFGVTSEVGMINFQLGAFVPSPASPSPETSVNNGVPRQVQIFGRLPNGKIAAVACDQYGNLAISGGTGGAINTVDLLGNDQAVPVMIYGALPSGEMVAVAVDSFGDLCATVGSGGGNAGTTVDIPVYTMATPVQIFAREPNSGRLIAIPLTTNNYLYDSVHPGTTPALSNPVDVTQNQYPTPVILCGRTPSGHIVAVSLDSAGRLCISGSGSSGSINTVDVFDNGECRLVQIYGRNPNTNVLQSVPLDSNGNLQLS